MALRKKCSNCGRTGHIVCIGGSRRFWDHMDRGKAMLARGMTRDEITAELERNPSFPGDKG